MSSAAIQPAPGEPAATLPTSDLEHGTAMPCLWDPPPDRIRAQIQLLLNGATR